MQVMIQLLSFCTLVCFLYTYMCGYKCSVLVIVYVSYSLFGSISVLSVSLASTHQYSVLCIPPSFKRPLWALILGQSFYVSQGLPHQIDWCGSQLSGHMLISCVYWCLFFHLISEVVQLDVQKLGALSILIFACNL